MERKPTTTADVISLVIPVILIAWFCIRSEMCRLLFPNMRTDAGEWDGANNLTMDSFAVMFLLSFTFSRFVVMNRWVKILQDILIGISLTDVADRLIFHIRIRSEYELLTFIVTIAVIVLDHYWAEIKSYGQRKFNV